MKRILIGICACVLALSICACTAQNNEQKNNNEASNTETNTQAGTESSNSKSNSNESEVFGPVQTYDVYEHGQHHVRMTFKNIEGYVEITIYSTSAPKTSSLFCHLVREGYYKGKTVNTIMKELYIAFGDRSNKTKGEYLAEGEYEEAGTSNDISLKRGVIAMSRTDDGKSSDASKILIMLNDASYLNGSYAAFGRVTKGLDILDGMSSLAFTSNEKSELEEFNNKLKEAKAEAAKEEAKSSKANKAKQEKSKATPIELHSAIKVKDDGTIKKKKKCPVIKSMKVVD